MQLEYDVVVEKIQVDKVVLVQTIAELTVIEIGYLIETDSADFLGYLTN